MYCLEILVDTLPALVLRCFKKLDNFGRDNLIFAGIIPYKSSDPGDSDEKSSESERKVLIKFIFPFIFKSSHLARPSNVVSPRCKPGTDQMSVGALNMHSMQVKCEVEADPADSVKFHWTYNNTRNVSPVSIISCDMELNSHRANIS